MRGSLSLWRNWQYTHTRGPFFRRERRIFYTISVQQDERVNPFFFQHREQNNMRSLSLTIHTKEMMGPVAAAAVSESVSVRQQTYMLNRHMKDGRVCRVEGGGNPPEVHFDYIRWRCIRRGRLQHTDVVLVSVSFYRIIYMCTLSPRFLSLW
jgi:hypothetical protein